MSAEIVCSDLSGVALLSSCDGHEELQRDVTRAGVGSVCDQIAPAAGLYRKGKYCVLLSMVSFVHLTKWASGLEGLESIPSSASNLEHW